MEKVSSDKASNGQKIDWKQALKYAGAILAYLIGSGYASGQEVAQSFTVYGWRGFLGMFAFGIFMIVIAIIMKHGRTHRKEKEGDVYRFYLGKYAGAFMEWFTYFFLLLVEMVMISGAAASLSQYFHVSTLVGSIGMAILVILTTSLGLQKVVSIVGKLGGLTFIVTIFVSIWTVFSNPGAMGTFQRQFAAAKPGQLTYAAGSSSGWFWLGAILFIAYNYVAGVPFIATLGKNSVNQRTAFWGGILGGIGLFFAAFFMNLALFGHFNLVYTTQVPMLQLAINIHPVFGFFFFIILLACIYDTAAPMMWSLAARFTPEGASKRRYNTTIVIATAIAWIGAQLPFDKLVGIVYPFSGYFGIVLLVAIFAVEIYHHIKSPKGAAGDTLINADAKE